MKTQLVTRTGATLSLDCQTLNIRDSKGTLLPMKKWIESNHAAYADYPIETQRKIKAEYNLLKVQAMRENKAIASALVSHDGMNVKRVAVRTLKDGSHTFSVSGGEKPKERTAKTSAKTSALEAQNAKLLAEIAALKAEMRAKSIPADQEAVTA